MVISNIVFEDGRYLASGSADSTLRLWDVESGVTLRVFQGHTASVTGIITDGKKLFSSSIDSTIKQWEIARLIRLAVDKSAQRAR